MSKKSGRSPPGLRSEERLNEVSRSDSTTNTTKEPGKIGLRLKSSLLKEKQNLTGKFSRESVNKVTARVRPLSLIRPRSGESVGQGSLHTSESGTSLDRPSASSKSSVKIVENKETDIVENHPDTKSVKEIYVAERTKDELGVTEVKQPVPIKEVVPMPLDKVDEVEEAENYSLVTSEALSKEPVNLPSVSFALPDTTETVAPTPVVEPQVITPSNEPERRSATENDFEVVSTGSCVVQMRSSMDRTSMSCKNNFKPVKQQLDSKKVNKLLQIIEKYPIGVDMKLSLYIAACSSTLNCLCPYPNVTPKINLDPRSIEFTAINEEIPSVNLISFFLKSRRNKVLRSEVYPLIFWLIGSMGPRMVLLKKQEHKLVLRKVTSLESDLEPSMIFKLMNSRLSRGEVMWQGVKTGLQTTFAFHNCQVEDAHTLIHYGLHKNLNRHGVHGPGIYLTDDLQGCLGSSPPGYTWGKSEIGCQVRIVFVVEFVNHPSVLCYSGASEPFSPGHSGSGDSMRCYYLNNPQLARIRYMLVYITKPSKMPSINLEVSTRRRRLVKLLNISRILISLIILGMGATASSRASFPTFYDYLKSTVQQMVDKISLKS